MGYTVESLKKGDIVEATEDIGQRWIDAKMAKQPSAPKAAESKPAEKPEGDAE